MLSDYVKDMKSIGDCEETSDIELLCNGKVFKCHKAILGARSIIFKNMLLHNTCEKVNRKVDIKDSTTEAVG